MLTNTLLLHKNYYSLSLALGGRDGKRLQLKIKGYYELTRKYGTLFLYLVDGRPGGTKREQRAQTGKRGERRKIISACSHAIALVLSPSTRPQKLPDKYQTHHITAAILQHAVDSNSSSWMK